MYPPIVSNVVQSDVAVTRSNSTLSFRQIQLASSVFPVPGGPIRIDVQQKLLMRLTAFRIVACCPYRPHGDSSSTSIALPSLGQAQERVHLQVPLPLSRLRPPPRLQPGFQR